MTESPGSEMDFGPLVGAIDQGTSSTRFLVFAANSAQLVTYHQVPVRTRVPRPGWAEQDPMELMSSVRECMNHTVENLRQLRVDPDDIVTIGITNQRETTIVWNKVTGEPLHNAILWLDTRTEIVEQTLLKGLPRRSSSKRYLFEECGLPISSYFSALKLKWLMENVPKVKEAHQRGELLFGTVDTWILWNLTGTESKVGEEFRHNGIHVTDVTNASRTMLMSLETLEWSKDLCRFFNIPMSILPSICSCSEVLGKISGPVLKDVTISGCIGDQQAALVGQQCFRPGQTKSTLGTGCFLLQNVGQKVIYSQHGLLSTVAYQLGRDQAPVYALEGSIAAAGSAMQWLKNEMKLVKEIGQIEELASAVSDSCDIYLVPAFTGLMAPHWRPDARGTLCGLTYSSGKEHLCRAILESIAFQTKDIITAMNADSKLEVSSLLISNVVDGMSSASNTSMQIHADILGIPILQSSMAETTALGAAMIAGSAKDVNVWNLGTFGEASYDQFLPRITDEERDVKQEKWKGVINRSLNWHDPNSSSAANETSKPITSDRTSKILGSVSPAIFAFSTILLLKVADYMLQEDTHT